MALKLYSETAIQDIADAIRSKNGSSDTYTVAEMAQAIEDIPSGGGIDSLLDGSLQEINSNVTLLKRNAIVPGGSNGAYPTSINLPECTRLDRGSISYTSYANSIIYFRGLTYLNLPKVSYIDANSISGIQSSGLTRINLPSLSSMSTTSNHQHFQNSSSVKVFDLGNSSITSMSLGQGKPWYQCTATIAIVLRYGGVCAIGNTSVFHRTNTASLLSGDCKIYVPSNLLESYKTATNWSSLYASYPNMFQTIEGSEYE